MPTPKAIQNLLLNNLKNVKHSISEEEIKNLSENMKGYFKLNYICEKVKINERLFV